jgi:hypothetical protein
VISCPVRHYWTRADVAYVRKKKVKGWHYYQLVQSRRVDGEPRQRVLLHLGAHPTVNHALQGWPKEIKTLRTLARQERRKVAQEQASAAHRRALKRAASAEKRAHDLERNLRKLLELRQQGVA